MSQSDPQYKNVYLKNQKNAQIAMAEGTAVSTQPAVTQPAVISRTKHAEANRNLVIVKSAMSALCRGLRQRSQNLTSKYDNETGSVLRRIGE
jgi:hypothetical protein